MNYICSVVQLLPVLVPEHVPQNGTPNVSRYSRAPSPQPLATMNLSVSVDLPVLDVSYQWDLWDFGIFGLL